LQSNTYEYLVDFEIEENFLKKKGCSIIAKSKVNKLFVSPGNKEIQM